MKIFKFSIVSRGNGYIEGNQSAELIINGSLSTSVLEERASKFILQRYKSSFPR